MIERLIALLLIALLWPFLVLLSLVIVIGDGWPFWFCQKRVGKDGKIFGLLKFRSMRVGADKEQDKYRDKNEADGPVFKIYNDPRLTRTGRFLFHSGLDELMQLFNIVKGEMGFVGPRPLPVAERNSLPKKYIEREKVLPGIISPWVFMGYHRLSFNQWMESDLEYVRQKSLLSDIWLFTLGGLVVLKLVIKEIIDILTSIGKSG